jgi:chloramphenicol-sensitive protein RarD
MWYAIGAYASWGLFPIYFKWLDHVPALQLLGHRIMWSFLMLWVVVLLAREWRTFWALARTPHILALYSLAGVLVAINWLVFIWAVTAGFIIQASLGYFILPLVSVLMGVIFLRERLRPWQWVSVALATAGVGYLTVVYGVVPWIALSLALSTGIYGLVKKVAPLGSLHGMALETGVLMLPALFYLVYAEYAGNAAFLHTGALSDVLMIGAGLLTAGSLLLFASAARRITLTHMGFLQYIAPTMQFLIGVLVYKEPFPHTQFIGYSMVWTALVIFVLEGFIAYRARAPFGL